MPNTIPSKKKVWKFVWNSFNRWRPPVRIGSLKINPFFISGTGYRLSFLTFGVPQEEAITSAVRSVVPETYLKSKTINSLTFSLPTTDTSRFPELFASLEAQRAELGIDSIGLGVATLEEVFLSWVLYLPVAACETYHTPSTLSLFELSALELLLSRSWSFLTNRHIMGILVITPKWRDIPARAAEIVWRETV